MRLHHRIMLLLCGVSALILGISLFAVHELVIRDELASLDRALLMAAHNTAHQYAQAEEDASISGVITVPESLVPTPSLVAVYGSTGALVRSSTSFNGGAPRLEELGVDLTEPVPWEGVAVDLTLGGSALRGVIVPLKEADVLLYAASSSMITEDRRFLIRSLPVLFLLAMVVTAMISRGLGRLFARDVERLAQAVDLIGQGNLDTKVSESVGGSRETVALAKGLEAMAAQLKSLLESKRRFITDAAHELRSPLATLRGELQLALRRQRTESEYRDSLARAVEDVESLSTLADELLVLARPQDRANAHEPVQVAEVVGLALRSAEGTAALHSVDLHLEEGPEALDLEVLGHRSTLVRCLRNIIDNAVLHGAAGGSVTVKVSRRGAQIEIAVEDRGPGVNPREAELVFAPFFRGRETRASEQGGAGLGLALARRGVAEHGGDLTLDPSYSEGARFVITLPVSSG